MPQLNPAFFGSQLFWLLVSFVVLYLLLSRMVLPQVAQVLQSRQEKISGDLTRAQMLRDEAEKSLEAYRNSLADARADAQRLQREAAEAATAEAARQQAEVGQRVGAQVTDAERRIGEQRNQAIAGLRGVATEVAQAAFSRLTGAAGDAGQIGAAVDRAMQGGGR